LYYPIHLYFHHFFLVKLIHFFYGFFDESNFVSSSFSLVSPSDFVFFYWLLYQWSSIFSPDAFVCCASFISVVKFIVGFTCFSITGFIFYCAFCCVSFFVSSIVSSLGFITLLNNEFGCDVSIILVGCATLVLIGWTTLILVGTSTLVLIGCTTLVLIGGIILLTNAFGCDMLNCCNKGCWLKTG